MRYATLMLLGSALMVAVPVHAQTAFERRHGDWTASCVLNVGYEVLCQLQDAAPQSFRLLFIRQNGAWFMPVLLSGEAGREGIQYRIDALPPRPTMEGGGATAELLSEMLRGREMRVERPGNAGTGTALKSLSLTDFRSTYCALTGHIASLGWRPGAEANQRTGSKPVPRCEPS